MTHPFFQGAERQAALRREIGEWRGTRFWGGCGSRAKKGVGADCVSFAEKVLVNVGAIERIEWPRYAVAGGGPDSLKKILEAMGTVRNMGELWLQGLAWPELLPGDVFLRSFKDDYHHLAIFGGGKTLWHFWPKQGLREANICDRQATKHVQAIYRVYDRAA